MFNKLSTMVTWFALVFPFIIEWQSSASNTPAVTIVPFLRMTKKPLFKILDNFDFQFWLRVASYRVDPKKKNAEGCGVKVLHGPTLFLERGLAMVIKTIVKYR